MPAAAGLPAAADASVAAGGTIPSTGVLQQLYEQQQIFGYHNLRARQAHQFYSELCDELPEGSEARLQYEAAIQAQLAQLATLKRSFDQILETKAEAAGGTAGGAGGAGGASVGVRKRPAPPVEAAGAGEQPKRVKLEAGGGGGGSGTAAARVPASAAAAAAASGEGFVLSMPTIMPLPGHVLSQDPSAQQFEPLGLV